MVYTATGLFGNGTLSNVAGLVFEFTVWPPCTSIPTGGWGPPVNATVYVAGGCG